MSRRAFTPTRIVAFAIVLSLLTFFWTFAGSQGQPEPVPFHLDREKQYDPPEPLEKPAKQPHVPPHVPQTLRPSKAPSKSTLPTQATPLHSELTLVTALPTSTNAVDTEDEAPSQSVEDGERGHATRVSTSNAPYPTAKNSTIPAHLNGTQTACKDMPRASDIMVIVKISKSEMREKLPSRLDDLLSCVPHFAIFSEHSGTIRNYTVHDALEGVTSATKKKHDVFKDYEKLRTQPAAQLSKPTLKKLDKWMMLPMLYKAHKMRPESRFYVIISPDTSLSWTNLVQWVDRLDPRIPYYIGAPLMINNMQFAQHGPGILLSNNALQRYAKAYDELYASKWETLVERECCGDVVLGQAMSDAYTELHGTFPLMNSDKPDLFGWTQLHWCKPSVTWHNLTQAQIATAWEFEKKWTRTHGWERPYVMRDVFKALVKPRLVNRTDEWDNLSADTKLVRPALEDLTDHDSQEWYRIDEGTRQAVNSWEDCKKVCEATPDCMQWKHSAKGDGECHLGKTIKLGEKSPKRGDEPSWTSGWYVERIHNITRDWKCSEPNWLHR
ncbi:glycosyltransferase family 31 protein [Sporormia fimetaria CBS 119925]|uniref:Glycosyltransferase family 31 protein n=1 Tax=Sporormia fimetaria CBS 119925 TaxID=1340428 RepID=A0A6A6V2U2_9PLEO|nr:glycosyltransferase family 31 protein [Sporormia fimetaria CBS 119925]